MGVNVLDVSILRILTETAKFFLIVYRQELSAELLKIRLPAQGLKPTVLKVGLVDVLWDRWDIIPADFTILVRYRASEESVDDSSLEIQH